MSISKARGLLHWIARLPGNVHAVRKGKALKPIIRRAAGRGKGKILGKLFILAQDLFPDVDDAWFGHVCAPGLAVLAPYVTTLGVLRKGLPVLIC